MDGKAKLRKSSMTHRERQMSIYEKDGQRRLFPHHRKKDFLPKKFIDNMWECCFQYINLATIKEIFFLYTRAEISVTTLPDINDDHTLIEKSKYHNTICFKGDEINGGHYVYVHAPEEGPVVVYGTFEQNILTDKDSGLCHLYAVMMAIMFHNVTNFMDKKMPYHRRIHSDKYECLINMSDIIHGTEKHAYLENYYILLSFCYDLLWKKRPPASSQCPRPQKATKKASSQCPMPQKATKKASTQKASSECPGAWSNIVVKHFPKTTCLEARNRTFAAKHIIKDWFEHQEEEGNLVQSGILKRY